MMTYPYSETHTSNFPDGLRPPAWRLDLRFETALQSEQGSIQLGVAREVAPLLRHLGADPDPVIRAAGLDLAMLTDPDAIIPLGAFCELIIRSGACTGCPHFGLLLGQRVRLSSLGLVGSLMLNCETVGDALRTLVRHVDMHCVGATTALIVKEGTAVWNCVVYEPGIDCADQIADAAAAAGTNVLRALCGADWSPTEVLLPRSVPADELTYRQLFGAPVRFNREVASLVFPAFQLDHPIPGADPALLQTLRERLAEQSRRATPDFASRLRHRVRIELMHGHCSAERIAGLLCMHRRTLARRLSAEGTTFSVVADQGRFEIARQLIDHTDIPLAQIAAALGFSEASAFTRAFRRWSGDSPSAWRTGHRR
ncbi:AraC family transcriptional regulator [Methylobacterium oxalidis]|uniref:AraC family transcriptional regulator n=1 Tax=Methylobacterium oxalidis TaxID=944322 RepID=A0A512JA30_9HYPH|nr:AraC family transcriptional regulator [Methylobacterium oxalidis]GEP06793.1 AraC family transcriptional regulator [Methylobacterium oxalidis]GJE34457.1 HTH-type transcriptional regulator VirS [Methylobacterium oxalidis]GLS67097.1 AraC family transcriptional regulator [Methylobacterium oxalidis]